MSASESENDDPDSHLYLNQNQMVNEIGLDHERIRQVVDSVFRNIEHEQSQETRKRSKKFLRLLPVSFFNRKSKLLSEHL